jgi:hypothetical protein
MKVLERTQYQDQAGVKISKGTELEWSYTYSLTQWNFLPRTWWTWGHLGKCPCVPHQSLICTKQPNSCPFADQTLLALRRCKLGWDLFNCSLNLEKPSCTNRTVPRLISAKLYSIVTKEHLERATPVYLSKFATCDQPSTLNVKLLTLVARLPKKKISIRYSSHNWQDILPV